MVVCVGDVIQHSSSFRWEKGPRPHLRHENKPARLKIITMFVVFLCSCVVVAAYQAHTRWATAPPPPKSPSRVETTTTASRQYQTLASYDKQAGRQARAGRNRDDRKTFGEPMCSTRRPCTKHFTAGAHLGALSVKKRDARNKVHNTVIIKRRVVLLACNVLTAINLVQLWVRGVPR